MNHIALRERSGNLRFDILIDGHPLQEHFVGRHGSHPSQVFVLGWRTAQIIAQHDEFDRLIGRRGSTLVSGRVPILVCEECGDIGCGAIAARIERNASIVTWSDWSFENGYEPARALDWLSYPATLQFDWIEYEGALASIVSRDAKQA
jgi:hypothetical protein